MQTCNEQEEIVICQKQKKKMSPAFIAGLIYFIVIILFVLFKIAANYGFLGSLSAVMQDITSSFIIQVVLMFAIPLILFTTLKTKSVKGTFKEFGFRKLKFNSVFICIAIGFVVFILNSFIATFFATIIAFLGAEPVVSSQPIDTTQYSMGMFFLTILLSCILPAVCEEFSHRGMLIGAYKGYGASFAIFISALCFGLTHMNINQVFYAFLIGILLGYIFLGVKSIYPCMIIHFMNNFLNTVVDFSYVNGWFGGGPLMWEQMINAYLGPSVSYLLNVIIFFASAMLLVWLLIKLFKIEWLEEKVQNMSGEEQFNCAMFIENRKRVKSLTEHELINARYVFCLQNERYKAKQRGVPLIEHISTNDERRRFLWYDNILVYSAIFTGVFCTIYTFLAMFV